jgi:protein-S-isoprenylcysteine O-methyltransferase Ste14
MRLIIYAALLLALVAAALYAIFHDNEFREYIFYPVLDIVIVSIGGLILSWLIRDLRTKDKDDKPDRQV